MPPTPPVPSPNIESRSAAKLCATVLVARECLLGCPEGWGTYPSGRDELLESSAMALLRCFFTKCFKLI